MLRYRIGRIEERWINFLPPIQGGQFRPLSDNDSEDPQRELPSVAASGTQDRSRLPKEQDPKVLRKRCETNGSSCSKEPDRKGDDGMAYLDSQTREKINLDLNSYPSLDFSTQDAIVQKYRALNDRIRAEGLYQCNYGAYAVEISRYLLLFSLMVLFLRWQWFVPSAFCLGAFWHQLVFTAHDAGHMGITHDFQVDTIIGIFIADFLGGLSLGVSHLISYNWPDLGFRSISFLGR